MYHSLTNVRQSYSTAAAGAQGTNADPALRQLRGVPVGDVRRPVGGSDQRPSGPQNQNAPRSFITATESLNTKARHISDLCFRLPKDSRNSTSSKSSWSCLPGLAPWLATLAGFGLELSLLTFPTRLSKTCVLTPCNRRFLAGSGPGLCKVFGSASPAPLGLLRIPVQLCVLANSYLVCLVLWEACSRGSVGQRCHVCHR